MPERVARVSRCASAAAGWVASSTTPSRASPAVTSWSRSASSRMPPTASTSSRSTPAPASAFTRWRSCAAAGLARGGHAVGDQQDARAPARRRACVVGRPAQRAVEIDAPSARRSLMRRRTTSPSALARAGEDRRDVLIERRDREHGVGAGALRSSATSLPRPRSGRRARARATRWCRSAPAATRRRRGARCRRAARCAPPTRFSSRRPRRPRSPSVRDLEVASGREALLADLDDLALRRAHRPGSTRVCAAGRGLSDQRADRQVPSLGSPRSGRR